MKNAMSRLFSQHTVLVSWNVKSCGGSRTDKGLSESVAKAAVAESGTMRVVREHLPKAMRKEVLLYTSMGRKAMSTSGVPWGANQFLIPLDKWLSKAKPELVRLETLYRQQAEIWAKNWDVVLAESKRMLGKSYDPSVLPTTEDAVKAAFVATYDFTFLPPATVELDDVPDEIREELQRDIRETYERKIETITAGLLEEVVELASKFVEVTGKIDDGKGDGRTARSLRIAKDRLRSIGEKVAGFRGDADCEALTRLTTALTKVATAVRDDAPTDVDALQDAIKNFSL